MAAQQTILFTVIPRGGRTEGDTLPVSVIVSPRLGGEDRLGAYPDWVRWTRRLREVGLSFVLRCAGQNQQAQINSAPLRPDLWEQLFNEETLVRSHQFNDYSGRGVLSYPMREALSAIKSIYQEAAVTLALPTGATFGRGERTNVNRLKLAGLVKGLEAPWSAEHARRWRAQVRDTAHANGGRELELDGEGLLKDGRSALPAVARSCAVFHHMPTPPQGSPALDPKTVLDFHQVLSSLDSYPELMRALGLVFDLDLPADFVKTTPLDAPGSISIAEVGFAWQIQARTPALATSYVHFKAGEQRLFFTGSRTPKTPPSLFGLLWLNPQRFGLAQVDVDGAMHKTMILAETWHSGEAGRNLDPKARPQDAPHPEVFDPDATLPSLRSGGFSLFADRRAAALIDTIAESKSFNDALQSGGAQPRPFALEDLILGYRLDIWDSRTDAWHSLHLRKGEYEIGDLRFSVAEEEGFVQLAVMQPARGAQPADPDLYLHEAIARWAGWSLSVPWPSKHLSRYADPDDALPHGNDPDRFLENQPVTPFKLTSKYSILPGSLPRLRFGTRYRIRARIVDLAGNSLPLGDPLADALAGVLALPAQADGFPYLRYEPVIAPIILARDPLTFTNPGSALDRLVIRTFNTDLTQDEDAAAGTADRHILPPRTSAEMGERLGMFDDTAGKLKSDAATWQLISERDAGEFQQQEFEIAGKRNFYPIEPNERIDALPYLPDPLARGAAFRDLPGSPPGTRARVAPDGGAARPVNYEPLDEPNPRPGSATLIRFGANGDWEQTTGFRLLLTEPAPNELNAAPSWDPAERLLTVFLTKGETKVVPLSSYVTPDDLRVMGVWRWLREYIERIAEKDVRYLEPEAPDHIAHVLQRAVEGGHWMLTPPQLLTFVHAVQQPIGRPAFMGLDIESRAPSSDPQALQTAPISGRTDPTELAPITAWRRLGATDAYLIGALKVHGSSTAKVEITAQWADPVDDEVNADAQSTTHNEAPVDEIPLGALREDYLFARGKERRAVGYYDPERDQIAFARDGDTLAVGQSAAQSLSLAAPRHVINDTKHHRIHYTATATSRYREYFPQDQALDFTRESESILVDVPASARPLAPSIAYVLPTFGWQRQSETNVKRSVRFGGGLRVYLHRPWYSSGVGELLGVALWSSRNGTFNDASRVHFKPYITQWGMDPIWSTDNLTGIPHTNHFPGALAEHGLSLEERSGAAPAGQPVRIDVAGFPVEFDQSRGLWFSDVNLETGTKAYMPFVRLALVRYQPHALADAKVSRVVLADFAQLTPDRSALVTADPHRPRSLQVIISGIAPRGPKPVVRRRGRVIRVADYPTQISVRVQQRDAALQSDLAWSDVGENVARIQKALDGRAAGQPDIAIWKGSITFNETPAAGQFRLLVEEYEYVSANYALSEGEGLRQPGHLIYAETFLLDDALTRES